MIDYKEIVDNLVPEKVKELLIQLGAETIIEKDNCFITNTICHNENGGSLKLYFYYDTHIFYCYSNCESMSIFNFLKHYYEVRNIEYNWYDDIVEVIRSCGNGRIGLLNELSYKKIRDRYAERKNRRELPPISDSIMDVFTKTYPVEWLQDGISESTMDKYNIKYSIPQNKIIIPHYDVNGKLVGIRGRALDAWEIENVGKYMPVQIENKWYSHPLSLNLYGLNYNKKNIKKYKICYVGESEKFVLQSEGFHIPNCSVAVCGSSFNKYHLDLLLRYCKPTEVVICFDKEEKPGEHKYFDKLYDMCAKYKNYTNLSFIYDRKNLIKLKDSPTDNGEEIFKKLIKERIYV